MIVGPSARDKGKPVQRRGRKANEAKALHVRAMPVGLPWTGDSTCANPSSPWLRCIAAVACTDATAPEATPPVNAYLKSDAKATATRFSHRTVVALDRLLDAIASLVAHHDVHDGLLLLVDDHRAHVGRPALRHAQCPAAVRRGVRSIRRSAISRTHCSGRMLVGSGHQPRRPATTADMRSWFASHTQYSLEKAFVHKRGATSSTRRAVSTTIGWAPIAGQ